MGAPRSRFAAQFVTLLQLQTCCFAVCADSDHQKSNQSNTFQKSSKRHGSGEKLSGKSPGDKNHCQNRELEQENDGDRQIVEIRPTQFEKIKHGGQHDMKRRNVLDGKPRRPVKRPTTSSKIGENFYGR